MQISVARHSLGVSTGRTAGFGYSFTGSDVKGAKGWRWRCGSPRPSPHRRLEGWLICALGGRYGSIKLVRAGPLFARLEKPLYLAGDDEYERFDLTGKAVGLIAVHNAYSLNSEIKTELLPGVGGRHRRYAT